MAFEAGQFVGGSYRIVRLLGKGGMGAVYEVEHAQLGVHYALKTFTFEGGHVDVLKSKFLAEGKVLARLQDPHLVRVFDLDFDEATGTPYFVMDLVLAEDGNPRTLADVKTAELDEDRVLQWFRELAAAIDYIHARGIVHRDIKLGNVLLSAEGHVVLSDFGVSRLFSERLRSDVDAVRTMVSEAGTTARLVMGTQGYMAPEVVRGEAATPAADAYSLGVMFVYLLTGLWYEPGSKVFKLLETLEYRWIDVLPRLLAEDPAERPACLAELVKQLGEEKVEKRGGGGQRNVSNSTVQPSTSNLQPVLQHSSRLRRLGIVLAVLGTVVLVVAAAYFLFSHHADSSTIDDFGDAFGVRGIYEAPRK